MLEAVASILKSLSLMADPTRVRLVLLLRDEELSVAELQEILSLPQSNISAQLARLKSGGLVKDRRSGKNKLYSLTQPDKRKTEARTQFLGVVESAGAELAERKRDITALKVVRRKRSNVAQAYFDALAGKFGRQYVPGRSWKGLAETLIKLLPPMVIADLGAGEGTLSQLLAQHAKRVIAVDNAPAMVAYGADLARQHGFKNLEFRLGDLEEPPIEPKSVDLALFSQALHHARQPERALQAAEKMLKPGGRLVVLDLLKHNFEKAREMYADVWLGFSEVDLQEMIESAGFKNVETKVVHREQKSPHFQTVLAVAEKDHA
jgi:ubiquinone/menaquinone biosynthesis C-methylase UbiE/DNA-binding transcriptional ArsR family regulator